MLVLSLLSVSLFDISQSCLRRDQWSLQSQLVSQFEDITHHFIHIQVFNTCARMFVIITLIGWRVIASANDACCFKTHVLVVTGNGCCLVALQH